MGRQPLAIHLPDWQGGNPYQQLLADGIRQAGWRVDFSNFPDAPFPLNSVIASSSEATAIHIHWINPYIERIMWSGSLPRFLVKSLLMMLDILVVRLRGKRVTWTVHNRISHESPNPRREAFLRRLIARGASRLIFHSEGARNTFREEVANVPLNKSSVIPHGNYIGVYPQNNTIAHQLADKFGITDKHMTVLFFGAVRRYKGLPRLIEAFRQADDPDLRLVIAGKPHEYDLRNEIEIAASKDPRIQLYLAHIPEQEVAPLFALADIVALPFEQTLTSGSVLLAMSLGKALLLPANARALDTADQDGAPFYDNEKQLVSLLYNLSSQDLCAMGKTNLHKAIQLGWNTIGAQTANQYAK